MKVKHTLLNIFSGSYPMSMAQTLVDFLSTPPVTPCLASFSRADFPASPIMVIIGPLQIEIHLMKNAISVDPDQPVLP